MGFESPEQSEEFSNETTRTRYPDRCKSSDDERCRKPWCNPSDASEFLDLPGVAALIKHA